MILWLFWGGYSWDRTAGPAGLGGTIIPWLCVLIIGLWLFGAIGGPNVVVFR
jgi:hypothetical protein